MPSWSPVLLGALLVLVAATVVDGRRPEPTTPLRAAPGGDGDSWRDTTGREHRLGLVDAPEVGECYGRQATQERRRLTADGFGAQRYAEDRYGRSLSVVTLPDGRTLNVHLARQGFVTDRYLDGFRDEHPELAAQLDAAFADARRARRGLWGAC